MKHLQADQVLHGIQQAVTMIDTQTLNGIFSQQLAQKLVSCGEDVGVFHSQSDQVIHIEEAAIVDLFPRNPPVRQPVDLRFQQLMQRVKAVWIARTSIALLHRLRHQCASFGRLFHKTLQGFREGRNSASALPD